MTVVPLHELRSALTTYATQGLLRSQLFSSLPGSFNHSYRGSELTRCVRAGCRWQRARLGYEHRITAKPGITAFGSASQLAHISDEPCAVGMLGHNARFGSDHDIKPGSVMSKQLSFPHESRHGVYAAADCCSVTACAPCIIIVAS